MEAAWAMYARTPYPDLPPIGVLKRIAYPVALLPFKTLEQRRLLH